MAINFLIFILKLPHFIQDNSLKILFQIDFKKSNNIYRINEWNGLNE